jgi:signal transduction histidine kinase/DNA-binding response OmpR family regulator
VGEQTANVLVVDDNPAQRLALTAILGDLGDVRLVEAVSGRDALRCALHEEFAVILLDVNMPGLDGFETAELIRERRSSRNTPIIFITAYHDDAYATRGYSLGAVDFIMAPVQPDVLRTKVSVFIDLYRKTQEVTHQREALRRYADQLQQLSRASLAIHSAGTIAEVLDAVGERAGRIVGARQVAITAAPCAGAAPVTIAFGSGSRTAAHQVRPAVDWSAEVAARVVPAPRRLTAAELDARPPWGRSIELIPGEPLRGWLAAPLTGHDGRVIGTVQLSEKTDGEFTVDDEGILGQLARMASIAIENALAVDAREANRLKDEFLGVLSHELRTPLQAMLTWVTILRREGSSNEVTLSRGLEVIERSARVQVQLIGDLLDVSRIIRGQLRLEVGDVDLVQVLDVALEALKPVAVAKEIALERVTSAAAYPTAGDVARLQQIVWNLVSNAIKFTPAGGRVSVRLTTGPRQAVLVVRDTGGGIPTEFLPHVFERFRQAESGSSRRHGGLGLGLAIVRHLVELHGGSVRVENVAEGAQFTVVLPREAVIAAPVAPVATVLPAPSERNGLRLDGLRIVLVEDETDAREALQAALQGFGADVVAVDSAAAALRALAEQRPDVLLSDIGLPGDDGYELIRQVRARDTERRMPAAAITAHVRAEDRAGALRAGFDAHVQKPVEPLELARVVRRLADFTTRPDER